MLATVCELRTSCVRTVRQVAGPNSDYIMNSVNDSFGSLTTRIYSERLSLLYGEITLKHYTHNCRDYKMSNPTERIAEDNYERENDASPVTGTITDRSYAEEPDPNLRDKVPIQPDDQSFEDPMQPPYSNSDQQLGKTIFIVQLRQFYSLGH